MIAAGVIVTFLLGLATSRADEQAAAASPRSCLTLDEPVAAQEADGLYVVSGTARCHMRLELFLAVRANGSQAWQVLSEQTGVAGDGPFSFSETPIGGARDRGHRFQVLVLGTAPAAGLAPGWRTLPSLRSRAAAVSASRTLVREAPARAHDVEARVLLDHLDGREVVDDTRAYHDVALEAFAAGRVHRPTGADVQCVVQPAGSDGRWVMHGGRAYDDRFDCVAQFGRGPGFDLFERFFLYAIVSRPKLAPGHGEYSPEEWARLIDAKRILAESPPVRTRRTIELPTGQAGAAISILQVDGTDIVGAGTLHVRQTVPVEGSVDGGLASHRVAVYRRDDAPDASWQRLGVALSTDARRWHLLPAHVGEPDHRVLLVAVRFQGRAPDLNRDEDLPLVVAHSPLVRVLVTEPAIEINAVDGRAVGGDGGTRRDAPLHVGPVARIEGTKADGRGADVAVYLRPADGNGRWSLLSVLPGAVGQRWETGDLTLPLAGEQVLVAVSGGASADLHELPSGAGVRVSRPIYLKVEER